MRNYQPSNHISAGGFILLLILAIISGLIVGAILGAIDYFFDFYLVLVFPIFAGAIAGGILALAVRTVKIRNPLVAVLSGVIAGLIMYGVFHFSFYYFTFPKRVHDQVLAQSKKDISPAELQKDIDLFLQDEVGESGFMGLMKYRAKSGLTITNATSSTDDTGIDLKDNLVWGYWGIEILVAIITAAAIARNAAKEPFDEEANQWYGKPMILGYTTIKSRKDFFNALKDGNFTEAGSMLTPQPIKFPHVQVNLRRGAASSSAEIMLIAMNMQRRNRGATGKKGMISAGELDSLKKGMASAVGQAPVSQKL